MAFNIGTQLRHSLAALNYGTQLRHSIKALNYGTQLQHSDYGTQITALKLQHSNYDI